jgi:endonuclease V-like protein UPF0215 family
MDLNGLLNTGRNIRSIGIDDAHYPDKSMGSPVHVAGVVCAGTRFEGMLWGEEPKSVARALKRITDQGKVPEPLRLAHLTGSAVMLGQSTKRA